MSSKGRRVDAPGLVACGIGGRRRLATAKVKRAARQLGVNRFTISLVTAVTAKLAVVAVTAHGH